MPRLPSFALMPGKSKLHHKVRITLPPTVPESSGHFGVGLITGACYSCLLVALHEIPHGLSLSRRRTAPNRCRDHLLGILPHLMRYLYCIACCTIRPQHPTQQYRDACRLVQMPVRSLLKLNRYSSHILPCKAPGRRTCQRFSFVQV